MCCTRRTLTMAVKPYHMEIHNLCIDYDKLYSALSEFNIKTFVTK